jgi:DNA helicase-2/ATP-dependent DNA helicase PcrA
VVFLTGMEETIFPHRRSIGDRAELEEERRLCYVGITRAKEELYLSYADVRTIFGQMQRNQMSRFIRDIPTALFLTEPSRRKPVSPTLFPPKSRFNDKAPTWDDMAKRDRSARIEKQIVSHDYRLSQKVKSAKFGVGTIVGFDGETIIRVAFPAPVGIKKLDVGFAKLEKIN